MAHTSELIARGVKLTTLNSTYIEKAITINTSTNKVPNMNKKLGERVKNGKNDKSDEESMA